MLNRIFRALLCFFLEHDWPPPGRHGYLNDHCRRCGLLRADWDEDGLL